MSGLWTGAHQISLNGKRDHFTLDDFKACAKTVSMKRGRAEDILDQVHQAVKRWPIIARDIKINESLIKKIKIAQRLTLLK